MRRYPNLMSPKRGGYWPECLGVVLIAVVFAAGSIALALLLATSASASAGRPAGHSHGRHSQTCQTVTFGWRTVTGHEADVPVTVCGLPIRQAYDCQLSKPLQPGTVAQCFTDTAVAGTAGPAR